VSTVDRYQGDENDIIILSLVRCTPGNRFVGLQNRFVVAVSRARLGFFVVGAVKALVGSRDGYDKPSGPAHWRRFIDSLQSKSGKNGQVTGTRCGPDLPICCPRHFDSTSDSPQRPIRHPSDFPKNWANFCSLPCQAVLLRCRHQCLLPCHSPVDVEHNTKCGHILKRPCEIHAQVELKCCDLDIGQQESVVSALARFKCGIIVKYARRECDHVVNISCYNKTQLEAKPHLYQLKECDEIVSDYYHPVCNHIIALPTCAKKRIYEQKAPRCTTQVQHRRPCGCVIKMNCYDSVAETETPPVCNASVQINRPRCGHKLSIRCSVARELCDKWESHAGRSAIDGKHF
jgi:hypothetical protein